MFSVQFWGVRGSIPSPGKDTAEYGGNTACVEIKAGKTAKTARRLIIDMGSGAKPLGDALMAESAKSGKRIRADVFITHPHLDHLLGLPMFTPLFIPTNSFTFYGAAGGKRGAFVKMLGKPYLEPYWPVHFADFAAKKQFVDITPAEQIGVGEKFWSKDLLSNDNKVSSQGLVVSACRLSHPGFCTGWRVDYNDGGTAKSVGLCFDHEIGTNAGENSRVAEFFAGVDLLVIDCQYTEAEYTAGKQGWGHSSWERSIALAEKAGPKKAAAFHHTPERVDAALSELEKTYAAQAKGFELCAAREGLDISL